MTEQEKMTAGELYLPETPELTAQRRRAKVLCGRLNRTSVEEADLEEHRAVMEELLGAAGENCCINTGFQCDYGYHITLGRNAYLNYNCVILDCAPVRIGENVMIAPNCGFYTAGHPLDAATRNALLEYAYPITVEDDVWIGGNVTVLPGVTIGRGSVIGAGSVVNRDIPPNTLAVGNPCRPIRTIRQEP